MIFLFRPFFPPLPNLLKIQYFHSTSDKRRTFVLERCDLADQYFKYFVFRFSVKHGFVGDGVYHLFVRRHKPNFRRNSIISTFCLPLIVPIISPLFSPLSSPCFISFSARDGMISLPPSSFTIRCMVPWSTSRV